MMNSEPTYTLIMRVSEKDRAIIKKIAQRYCDIERRLGFEPIEAINYELDLIATHANGCPLRLQELLEANDANFVHDIAGIGLHLNRTTGKLRHQFLPRFAA